ncbi:MAG: YceI family protein [Bacteroidota bacterium]
MLPLAFSANLKAAEKYMLNTKSSMIQWEGKKVLGKHDGNIMFKSGWIELNNDELIGGEFYVDMNSIENNDLKDDQESMNKLVGHLKSDDFFNVKEYPTSKLKISKVAKDKDYGSSTKYNVTGDLTIRNKTYTYTFPVTITNSDDKIHASALLTFDRSNHDVKFGSGSFFKGLGDKMIYDEVPLDMTVVFVK